ncbi:hypothetical protein K8Q98_01640 [Candidatus Nomurabacteria bacterium]|nr:hypothetical protein [Candidatus Nomurabacteria bacterium]
MTTSQKIIIVVLVVAILVLGFFIYKNQKSPIVLNTSENTSVNNTNATNNTNPTNSNVIVKPTVPAYVATLLASNPGSGATTEQLKEFSAKVFSYAVDASSIEVTHCVPNPAVARVFLNKPINFKNMDSIPHTLVNGDVTMNIPANKTTAITPKFAGPGIYGYSCDTAINGIFLVMP